MNRERAEGYLRQLAEAELRAARTVPAARIRRPQNTAGVALVAQALVAVGAVDADTADQIRADLELAVAVRQPGQENPARLMRGFSGRADTTVALDQALSAGESLLGQRGGRLRTRSPTRSAPGCSLRVSRLSSRQLTDRARGQGGGISTVLMM